MRLHVYFRKRLVPAVHHRHHQSPNRPLSPALTRRHLLCKRLAILPPQRRFGTTPNPSLDTDPPRSAGRSIHKLGGFGRSYVTTRRSPSFRNTAGPGFLVTPARSRQMYDGEHPMTRPSARRPPCCATSSSIRSASVTTTPAASATGRRQHRQQDNQQPSAQQTLPCLSAVLSLSSSFRAFVHQPPNPVFERTPMGISSLRLRHRRRLSKQH